jgi:hypothetical protein
MPPNDDCPMMIPLSKPSAHIASKRGIRLNLPTCRPTFSAISWERALLIQAADDRLNELIQAA